MMAYNDISLMDRYDPSRDPNLDYGGIARRAVGSYVKPAADIAKTVIKTDADTAKKAKIDKFVMEYNGKTGIFAGMEPLVATEKLSRLLVPLDQGMADSYAKRAETMRAEGADKELKTDLKTLEIQGDLDKKLLDIQAKGGVGELEQLWKDSNRVLAEAIRASDTPTVTKYTALVGKIEGLLGEKRPELWGPDKPKVPGPVVDPADDSKIKATILGAVDGKKIDGQIDDVVVITNSINEWARDNNVAFNTAQYKSLIDLLAAQSTLVKNAFDSNEEKRKEIEQKKKESDAMKRDSDKDFASTEAKYKAMYNAQKELQASPTDVTSKRKVMNLALRTETGAVIGADEFDLLMATVLPQDQYSKFRGEVTGIGPTLIGMASKDAQEAYLKKITEKYLRAVDSQKLRQYALDKMPTSYIEKAGKLGTSTAPKTETPLERVRRLKAGKK